MTKAVSRRHGTNTQARAAVGVPHEIGVDYEQKRARLYDGETAGGKPFAMADAGNILDYGADPTGVADSTTAITACIAAHSAVYIPPGTYKMSNVGGQATVIDKSNFVLFGDGPNVSVLASNDDAPFVFQFDSQSNVQLRNFSTKRTSASSGTVAHNTVQFINCTNVLVANVHHHLDAAAATRVNGWGVTLYGCQDVTIEKFTAINAQYGILIKPDDTLTERVMIHGCTFRNTRNASYPAGVNIAEGRQITVTGCTFADILPIDTPDGQDHISSYGVYTGDHLTDDFMPKDVIISNNTFENIESAIMSHHCDNIVVDGNVARAMLANFVRFSNDQSGAPENQVVSNNSANARILVGKTFGCSITGNTLSVETVELGEDAFDAGIQLPSVSASRDVSIVGNTIRNTAESGILVETTTRLNVSGNSIFNPNRKGLTNTSNEVGHGIALKICDFVTVSNNLIYDDASGAGDSCQMLYGIAVFGSDSARDHTFIHPTNVIIGATEGSPTYIKNPATGDPAYGEWNAGVIRPTPAPTTDWGRICLTSGTFGDTDPTFGKMPIEKIGTFTPSLSTGTHTYATQVGQWVSVGGLKWIAYELNVSSLDGAASGNVVITGIPAISSSRHIPVLVYPISGIDMTGYHTLVAQQLTTDTDGHLLTMTDGDSQRAVTYADLSSGFTIRVAGVIY